jgi:hypothetical protein
MDVPAEFRRVEYFISGTVPNRSLAPTLDETLENFSDSGSSPSPSPTPAEGTWQEESEPNDIPIETRRPEAVPGSVTVIICPVSRLRATPMCDTKESRTFRAGSEPSTFCPVHR